MKFLKNKAKKALMAAVTMSLVMGVSGSAMADTWYYGTKENGWSDSEANAVAKDFNGKWTASDGEGYYIYGGYSTTEDVSNNTITIDGGTIKGGEYQSRAARVTGGKTEGNGISSNNTINLLGGNFEGWIEIVGCFTHGNAENNTICIGGFIDNDGKVVTNEKWKISSEKIKIVGCMTAGNKSGNTLKVMSVGNKVSEIRTAAKGANYDTIQNMEFYIPATAKDGDVMLTVNNGVNLSNVAIKAGLENSSALKEGKITLIGATKIAGFDKDGQPIEKVSIGDFTEQDLTYEFIDGKNLNAVISAAKPKDDNPDAKSPVETQAAGLTMLTTGADMLASQGFDNAASAVANEISEGGSPNVMTPFVTMGGAKTKVKSGSHVDVKGWNLNIGLAKEIDNKAGKLLIGPVVEYGKGSYDSYLDNGYHGEGDTDYIGGGVMAKQTNDNGLYYEGSLRFGKLSNDYSSKTGRYDSDSTYYAAHVGLGKIVKLSDKNSLDYYGKYFYTHQKGDDTTLYDNGTPIDLHLDSVDSNRTRIGGRFTHEMNEKNSVYAGLAWQHEFSGTARATLGGTSTPAPSVKGNTGIMELGWKVNANKNLDLDLGATGYTGKQKGASLNLALNFKF